MQFDEAERIEATELPQEENAVTVSYTRKKPVRRPLPEQLEYIPAQLKVIAHARRPFAQLVKLAKTTGKFHQAVAYIQKLYLIEKMLRDNHYTNQQRYELRLEQAKPILDELKIWLEKSLKTAASKSKLGDALTYMHQRWSELTAYLLDGALEIDNNLVENLIRPFALGRKNWLYSGSPRGAHASALFYSLIATAKANGLNPFNYLKTLFENIRSCRTAEDYIALLPYALNPK